MAEVSSPTRTEGCEPPRPLNKLKHSADDCGCGGRCDGGCGPPPKKKKGVQFLGPGYYNQQLEEKGPFDIDIDVPKFLIGGVRPFRDFKERPDEVELMNKLATKALDKFNAKHNENYAFVGVEKVNRTLVAGFIYYITFTAEKKAEAGEHNKTFQAEVFHPLFLDKNEDQIMRCQIKNTT